MALITQIHIILIFLSYALNFAHDLIPHDHCHNTVVTLNISTKQIDNIEHHPHFHFGLFEHEHFSQTHNTQFRSLVSTNIESDCSIDLPCSIQLSYLEIDYQTKFLSYLALKFALSDNDRISNISDRAPPIA